MFDNANLSTILMLQTELFVWFRFREDCSTLGVKIVATTSARTLSLRLHPPGEGSRSWNKTTFVLLQRKPLNVIINVIIVNVFIRFIRSKWPSPISLIILTSCVCFKAFAYCYHLVTVFSLAAITLNGTYCFWIWSILNLRL